ncbi:hypothetical protein Y032_0633g904 [Ancylostoma ceylanicum]|uniref:Uncharacterized protein n=1 Tax=Ancylostoma ceylanicum TaxID=53326 RepID=A0A016WK63_9BILA|nr:hypothetical protein Y032_0633g904 [Ancylostoma ceylanicum]
MIRLLPSLLLTCFCSAEILGPLSDDFQQWLSKNGYQSYDFVRGDYGTQGSYGGKAGNVTTVNYNSY